MFTSSPRFDPLVFTRNTAIDWCPRFETMTNRPDLCTHIRPQVFISVGKAFGIVLIDCTSRRVERPRNFSISSPALEAVRISFRSSQFTSKTATYIYSRDKRRDDTNQKSHHQQMSGESKFDEVLGRNLIKLTVELNSLTTYAILYCGWNSK